MHSISKKKPHFDASRGVEGRRGKNRRGGGGGGGRGGSRNSGPEDVPRHSDPYPPNLVGK